MSLSPLVSFKSQFVTYLLNFPRINDDAQSKPHQIKIYLQNFPCVERGRSLFLKRGHCTYKEVITVFKSPTEKMCTKYHNLNPFVRARFLYKRLLFSNYYAVMSVL